MMNRPPSPLSNEYFIEGDDKDEILLPEEVYNQKVAAGELVKYKTKTV